MGIRILVAYCSLLASLVVECMMEYLQTKSEHHKALVEVYMKAPASWELEGHTIGLVQHKSLPLVRHTTGLVQRKLLMQHKSLVQRKSLVRRTMSARMMVACMKGSAARLVACTKGFAEPVPGCTRGSPEA